VRLSFKLNLAGVGLSVLDGALQEVLYASASGVRCSVYLLYWYKSTCFTGTKAGSFVCERLGCQVIGLLALLVQKYLLYWYKSTNTDWKTRGIRAQYVC
jgi:hypothetical protein